MYTIKEVAEKMAVSEHTLRFWAKSGFFPFVKRNENNIRQFSENDLNWVRIVKCLRSVGTETKAIKRYIDLCIIGDSTIQERYEIIKNTRKKALQQMEDLKKQLELLDYKEAFYKNLIKNNLKDSWNPMNSMKPEETAVQAFFVVFLVTIKNTPKSIRKTPIQILTVKCSWKSNTPKNIAVSGSNAPKIAVVVEPTSLIATLIVSKEIIVGKSASAIA